MASNIPSLEEMGVKDWFPEEDRTPTGRKVNEHILGGEAGRKLASEDRRRRKMGFNGLVFAAFAAPAYLAALFGAPMDYFHRAVYSIAHSLGHAAGCMSGSALLCGTGGALGELIFSIGPALLCFRDRDKYVAGLVFLMCASLSLQHAGSALAELTVPRLGIAAVNPLAALGYSAAGSYGLGLNAKSIGYAAAVLTLLLSTFGMAKYYLGIGEKD